MKKIILLFLALVANVAIAQTFPVQNLSVNGTATFSGAASFTVGPTAPTAAVGTSTTQLATTQYVVKHAPCPSILDYGGDNTGSTDNSTALTSTIAASPASQKCAFFPAGTYAFSASYGYTLSGIGSSISLLGAGSDVTVLKWAAGGGLTVNLVPNTSAHVRDMTLATGSVNVGNALLFSQSPGGGVAQSDITGVTIRGIDGFAATDYWQNGINITSANNVNIINTAIFGASTAAGTGIIIVGTASAIPVQFNIIGAQIANLNYGIYYGNYTQGVTVQSSNFTGDNYGIYSAASLTGLDQLYVGGSQFNCNTYGINTNTNIENTMIVGNFFLVPNSQSGIFLNASGAASIVGNTFNPTSGSPASNNGIVIGTTISSLPTVISGNMIYNMKGSGIWLQSASQYVNVQSNAYSGNGTPVTNSCTTGCTVGGGSQ